MNFLNRVWDVNDPGKVSNVNVPFGANAFKQSVDTYM